MPFTPRLPAADEVPAWIDHTLLKPQATAQDVTRLCDEAREYGFASVCVNPAWVPLASSILAAETPAVCTVIGFPLGATLPTVKAFETLAALQAGATEVDMVLNIGALKSGQHALVHTDIAGVVQVAHAHGALVKVILETALLERKEKIIACLLSKSAGADFVKTSTGFGPGGATAEDIELMRRVVGAEMGVKASGGVRTWEDMQRMVLAGATRIGASAGLKIAQQAHG
ncbi:MAG: deoxyribose-phosphate aldolase [Anaerolineae bacterium]|nr:MAG: deoxyribose-phosphate aldolase [Anaerolineae bacterium]